MTLYSTLDQPAQGAGSESAKAQGKGNKEQPVELGQQTRSSQPGVAAAVAAAPVRFPGDDGGNSLAAMAQSDLDAALQLLADRAQYITGANGAAIALRRNGKNDMQCRASTGENVPELGALLSTEFGISGESVRTRKPLRCDDAERDPRVNREGCRQLGIASVVVMPVVNDDEVLGVFELFSGKVNAFGERDLSALRRLSEMVETAVRLARAAENVSQPLLGSDELLQSQDLELVVESEAAPEANLSVPQAPVVSVPAVSVSAPLEQPAPAPIVPPLPKKPLFWSAALSPVAESEKPAEADQSHVPPMLRNLRMCEACGFPVSVGRSLCVECEEKRWRGQLKRPASIPVKNSAPPSEAKGPFLDQRAAAVLPAGTKNPAPVPDRPAGPVAHLMAAAQSAAAAAAPAPLPARPKSPAVEVIPVPVVPPAEAQPVQVEPPAAVASDTPESSSPDFVLSAGLEPPQSWFAANIYVVVVVLLVAAAVVATILLH